MQIWIPITMALALGCASSHAAPHGAVEHHDAPPLAIRTAWWQTPARLALVVELGGASGLPSGPEQFELTSRRGALHRAAPDPGLGACKGLLDGARRRCLVAFELEDTPSRLRFIATGAETHVEPCTPATPFGLCPLDAVCLAGACEPLCAPSSPDGHCLDDARRCVAGVCE